MKKTLVVLAIGTVLPLFAHAGIRPGIQVSTVTPMSTLSKTAKLGIGVSGFVGYEVAKGHTVIAKLDVKRFGSHSIKEFPKLSDDDKEFNCSTDAEKKSALCKNANGANNNVSTIGFGVDYKMNVKQLGGAYALVGVDVEHSLTSGEAADFPAVPATEEIDGKKASKAKDAHTSRTRVNSNSLGYSVGAGYDFNEKLGVQVRYNTHTNNHKATRPKHSNNAVSLGVTYTF